ELARARGRTPLRGRGAPGVPAARTGGGTSRAPARGLPRRRPLRPARYAELLAGRRRARRGLLLRRHRPPPVRGAERSARRGPLRADRARRWLGLRRLRAAAGRAHAAARIRAP